MTAWRAEAERGRGGDATGKEGEEDHMAQRIVGIADCKFSRDTGDQLVTYALGSCIAVVLYDPASKAGGMLHFMLPESSLDTRKAGQTPYMFADTGVPLLFQHVYALGGRKQNLIVRLAGGAQVMDAEGVFNIGKRNHLAVKKLLWKEGVFISSEHVGGTLSRTVRMELDGGRMTIREPGAPEFEVPLRRQARVDRPVAAPVG